MSTSEKKRIAKEADYIKSNNDPRSICCGVFYNRSKKMYEPCVNCTKCYKFKEYNNISKEEQKVRPEVKYHYIDSFRKCEFYKIKEIDSGYVLKAITYNMLYINDLACNCVKELEKYVYNSGDKELQKKYRAAQKRVKKYMDMVYDIIGNDIDFFAEYNGIMDDYVDKYADDMVKAIEDLYTSKGIDNYEFLSKVEMARTMTGYSVIAINKMVKEGMRLTDNAVSLYAYKLTELKNIMEDITNWAFRKVNVSFNMNEDKKLMEAYRAINRNLSNYELVNDSINKAETVLEKVRD